MPTCAPSARASGCLATTVRADEQAGKRLMRLEGAEFVDRLMLHVLRMGIKRIRHYGVLASACKGTKLDAARRALQIPVPSTRAQESATDFMARVARMDVGRCPCCAPGRLRCVAVLLGSPRLPTPGGVMQPPPNRGPP